MVLVVKILIIILDVCMLLVNQVSRGPSRRSWPRILVSLIALAVGVDLVQTYQAYREFNNVFLLYSLAFIPVYIVTTGLLILGIRYWKTPDHLPSGTWFTVGVCLAFVLLSLSGAYLRQLYLLESDEDVPVYFQEEEVSDLRSVSWTTAFSALNSELSLEYPFTSWKQIDWSQLYRQYAPQIASAQSHRDLHRYYLALRSYTFSIPDGHVSLQGNDFGLASYYTGGGYGLEIVGLDNGQVVVSQVRKPGSADRSGMKVGDTILSWNGEPINRALQKVSLIWCQQPVATKEGRKWEQYHYLTRAPVNSRVKVVFKHPGQSPRTAWLKALRESDPLAHAPWQENLGLFIYSPVEARILPSGFGYIKIKSEFPTLLSLHPEKVLRDNLKKFIQKGVPGVILDVRGNLGGSDRIAQYYSGFFVPREKVLEYPGVFNETTGQFEKLVDEVVNTEPQTPYYPGKVAVLVDRNTISAGEGIPLALKGLPNVVIIGIQGTQGSFGIGQKRLLLPGGYAFRFPQAQSLNAAGVIQVDSDARGNGGVIPDLRVPLNLKTVLRMNAGQDVVLDYAIKVLGQMR